VWAGQEVVCTLQSQDRLRVAILSAFSVYRSMQLHITDLISTRLSPLESPHTWQLQSGYLCFACLSDADLRATCSKHQHVFWLGLIAFKPLADSASCCAYLGWPLLVQSTSLYLIVSKIYHGRRHPQSLTPFQSNTELRGLILLFLQPDYT
jgi:hypothetical protein